MKGLAIGLDFDGTVVTHDYPEIGKDIGAVPVLKKLVENDCLLLLNTMRSRKNGTLQAAEKWFEENGLPLYGINKNPGQEKWTDSTKTYCNLYIDDAALGCPVKHDGNGRRYVDWEKVEDMLTKMGIIKAE